MNSLPKQRVEFYTTEARSVVSLLPDTYELRRDRGWLWVQRAAFFVLRKLGCYARRAETSYTRHVIDTRNIFDALYKQNAELFSLYHYKGERLLVGPEDWMQLALAGTPFNQPLSLCIPYTWQEQGERPRVMGLEVTIIPWMSGMLVLPKDDEIKRVTP